MSEFFDKRKESENRLLDYFYDSLGVENRADLEKDDVIELYINDDRKVWIDTLSSGRHFTGRFMEASDSMRVIQAVADYTDKIVDKTSPFVSSELPGTGSRFQGVIPPNVANPVFNIRKKGIKVFTLDDYVKSGSLTVNQKEIIIEAVNARKNILIVGATSTGKTTFANAVIAEIAKTGDRLIIMEDTKEIQSVAEDTLRLLTSDFASMLDLFKSSMRQRPDRLIAGEVRGEEALSMLTGWNSGHPGICTIHSYTAMGGLRQLEQYVQIKSVSAQEKLIASAVNLIIVIKKIGTERKITEIAKVNGWENGEYLLEKIA
ncbi:MULTISPECIES: P-type conjugative transfer ATPase TrbB [Fusobacterium]|jgi:P-type conjugative transfer ATPase trbB|uniref:P-type conjugative transfer ATPase TrbB n=1 Tax=Fusobacterium vincentii 4_1_13 TaxID=469606 RepID=A0A0M1VUK7_FUSVC|nr:MULTISPECIES: P-type conjugative transfer ATPase TrbB [Fusobacterium]EEO40305.1 P-type conjugative transfer ATPase TrbB [Fusobacterium vincentii 4_1_13]ERT34890.1 P-type conjugative transfer ATPase TrbB [Fusobacterium nucleatum CTI-3]